MLAWPDALNALGLETTKGDFEYRLGDGSHGTSVLRLNPQDSVNAAGLYPVREHGRMFEQAVGSAKWERELARPQRITYLGFEDMDLTHVADLERRIARAGRMVVAAPSDSLIIDLRGNPGGNFFKAIPFVDTLAESWRGQTCVVLVNKFTFSAAIVFAALLRSALGERMLLVGEDMGDDTQFFAEGDTVALLRTGAGVRYSTGYHDWKTGKAAATTPEVIAECLVAAGDLRPDQYVDIATDDLVRGNDPQLRVAVDLTRT